MRFNKELIISIIQKIEANRLTDEYLFEVYFNIIFIDYNI